MQVHTRTHSAAESGIQATNKWSLAQLVAFRFACLYLGLYNFTAILGWVPYSNYFFGKTKEFWHAVVPWVGKHALHLPHDITIYSNGSGDTTYDYVHVLCFIVLAIAGTVLWSLLDNKRPEYKRLHEWLRLYVRIALATTLIGYGISKFQQFPEPTLSTLLEPYGQSSPMSLLWAFMGASRAYCAFAGFSELLAGILLLMPGVTTLGALIGCAVMTNIFMLNMCYDVPVKLFSLNLLLMCVFLLAPEFNRLANFFVLNKTVKPMVKTDLFKQNSLNKIVVSLQVLFCCYLLYLPISYQIKAAKGEAQSKPLFDGGIWQVDNFSVNGELRPPLLTDNDRWQQLCFPYEKMLSLNYTNGKTLNYGINIDNKHKTLEIRGRNIQTTSDGDQLPENVKEQTIGSLKFTQPTANLLVFDGTLACKQIHTTLHHLPNKQFLLMSRGFHWIQEYPFDR